MTTKAETMKAISQNAKSMKKHVEHGGWRYSCWDAEISKANEGNNMELLVFHITLVRPINKKEL